MTSFLKYCQPHNFYSASCSKVILESQPFDQNLTNLVQTYNVRDSLIFVLLQIRRFEFVKQKFKIQNFENSDCSLTPTPISK